jgi:hypothetical protein
MIANIYSNIYKLTMKILSMLATLAKLKKLFSIKKLIVCNYRYLIDLSLICNQIFYSNINVFLK